MSDVDLSKFSVVWNLQLSRARDPPTHRPSHTCSTYVLFPFEKIILFQNFFVVSVFLFFFAVFSFRVSERPAPPDPRLQVEDRDRTDGHLRRHLEDHRGRAHPQLDVGRGQSILLQDEGRLPPVSFLARLAQPIRAHSSGQGDFGDKPVKFQVVCPRNGTAVLTLLEPQSRFGDKLLIK